MSDKNDIRNTALGTAGGILGIAGGMTIGMVVAGLILFGLICGVPIFLCFISGNP
jgi:hypothetical protein